MKKRDFILQCTSEMKQMLISCAVTLQLICVYVFA